MHSNTSAWGYAFLSWSCNRWQSREKWRPYEAATPKSGASVMHCVRRRFMDKFYDHPKARRLHANTHKARG
jgi:hypothetical protein